MFKVGDLVKVTVRPVETYAVDGSATVPVFIYPESSSPRTLTGKIFAIETIEGDVAMVDIDGADWLVRIPVRLLEPQ